MELQTPFKVTDVQECEKAAVGNVMIRLVSILHETHGVVHGDIESSNMLRCSDGALRLCDFDTARFIDEDPRECEGTGTEEYLSPNRDL